MPASEGLENLVVRVGPDRRRDSHLLSSARTTSTSYSVVFVEPYATNLPHKPAALPCSGAFEYGLSLGLALPFQALETVNEPARSTLTRL